MSHCSIAPTGTDLALDHAELRSLLRRVVLEAEHEDAETGESGHIQQSTIDEIKKALA